jgi:hypothetical protein
MNFVLEYAVEIVQAKQKVFKLNDRNQLLVYANDINILCESIYTTNKTTEKLLVATEKIGLEVDEERTTPMTVSCKQDTQTKTHQYRKSAVWSELSDQSVKQWQSEWARSSKVVTTKSFFPKIEDRMKLKINATPNPTVILTGHVNIKKYLYRRKILESPMCACEKGEQSVDHIIHECILYENERDRLKAAVRRQESWSISRNKLCTKYYKNFKEFTQNIELDKV